MNTVYSLDTFTLRNDENVEDDLSKIVIVKDVVKAEGIHVSYEDYMTQSATDLKQIYYEDDDISGRRFDIVERRSHVDDLRTVFVRYFGNIYSKSLPIVAPN